MSKSSWRKRLRAGNGLLIGYQWSRAGRMRSILSTLRDVGKGMQKGKIGEKSDWDFEVKDFFTNFVG